MSSDSLVSSALSRLDDDCLACIVASLVPRDVVALSLASRTMLARLHSPRILPLRDSLAGFSPPVSVLKAMGVGEAAEAISFARREAAAAATRVRWRSLRLRTRRRQGAAGVAVGQALLVAGGWTNGFDTLDGALLALVDRPGLETGPEVRAVRTRGPRHPRAYGLRAVLADPDAVAEFLAQPLGPGGQCPAEATVRLLLHGGCTAGSYRGTVPDWSVVDVRLCRGGGDGGEEAAAEAGDAARPAATEPAPQPASEQKPSLRVLMARHVAPACAGTRAAVLLPDAEGVNAARGCVPEDADALVPRAFHAAAWAGGAGTHPAHDGSVFLFGGFHDDDGPIARLQRARFSEAPPPAPGAAAAGAGAGAGDDTAAYSPLRGVVVSDKVGSGGADPDPDADAPPAARVRVQVDDVPAAGAAPAPCFGSSFVRVGATLLHFGGCSGRNNHKGMLESGAESAAVHALSLAVDPPVWREVTPAGPLPAFGRLHTAVYTGSAVLVFGGGPASALSGDLRRVTVDRARLDALARAPADDDTALARIGAPLREAAPAVARGGRGPGRRMDHVGGLVGDRIVLAFGYRDGEELGDAHALHLDADTAPRFAIRHLRAGPEVLAGAAHAASTPNGGGAAWAARAEEGVQGPVRGAAGGGDGGDGDDDEDESGSDEEEDEADPTDPGEQLAAFLDEMPLGFPTHSESGWRLLHEIGPQLGVLVPRAFDEDEVMDVVFSIQMAVRLTGDLRVLASMVRAQHEALAADGVDVRAVIEGRGE